MTYRTHLWYHNYYLKHRERLLLANKRWREKHKDEVKIYAKEYYREHKDRMYPLPQRNILRQLLLKFESEQKRL